MRLQVTVKDIKIRSDIQQKKYLFVYHYLYIKHGQAEKGKRRLDKQIYKHKDGQTGEKSLHYGTKKSL